MATRFASPVADSAEVSLRASAIPMNTKVAAEWGIRVWSEWADSRTTCTADWDGIVPVITPLLRIPHGHLAYWMGKFVLEVRKNDGKEYPPKFLDALVCCYVITSKMEFITSNP